jgi:CubicO group peptidase (beta-lactamase class C family)
VYPEMAAAGLWTTPSDLARFVLAIQRACRGDQEVVLKREMQRQMLTSLQGGRALGPTISADGTRFGHGGSNMGFQCDLTASIDGGWGAIVMTNSDVGASLVADVMRAIFDVYGWPGLETA